MQIDWITVVAQIVNFLILVYLLKRFLYQPVIQAMQRREQGIAGQLNEAAARERAADAREHDYAERLQDLERDREGLMERARGEVDETRKRLLQEARDEVARTRQDWQRQTQVEKEEFLKGLRRQAGDAVQSIARRALSDLADAEFEERVVDTFLHRLKNLDAASRKPFREASEPVRVATSFTLDAGARSRISRMVHEHLAPHCEVEYVENPELICGIELTAAGRRLGWNLSDYLTELAEKVERAFDRSRPAEAGNGAEDRDAAESPR